MTTWASPRLRAMCVAAGNTISVAVLWVTDKLHFAWFQVLVALLSRIKERVLCVFPCVLSSKRVCVINCSLSGVCPYPRSSLPRTW